VSERSVPYYCPYCGGEDLRPHEDTHGAWECRECIRVFSLKFLGILPTPAEESEPRGTSGEDGSALGSTDSVSGGNGGIGGHASA
jgi:hypothetical protein